LVLTILDGDRHLDGLGAAVSPVNPTFTADVHQAALANATVLLADSVQFNVEMSTRRIDHARANFIAT
jgi:hypothetical protein